MLSNLTEGVMYMLLVYWLGPLRPLLEEEPSLAWFPMRFEELREAMQTLRRNPQAAIDAARQAAGALDLMHDDRLRALWYGLLALELAADDPDERARLKDARTRILDRGLKMVNASYVDEAAEADLVLTRIDDDVLALMEANGFGEGTVLDLFESWRALARELGEKDRERTRIEQDVADNARGAYARLRNEWLQTVRAFRTMLSMVDPHKAKLLTEKLDEMEQRADLRVSQRRAQGEAEAEGEAPAVDGSPDGVPDDIFPADGSDGRADENDPDAAELAADVQGDPAPPAAAPADPDAGGLVEVDPAPGAPRVPLKPIG